jgi:hypothetical protein
MKFKYLIAIALFILLSTCLITSAEQLSNYEATKIASLYTFDDEICEAFGPYEYEDNTYYVCSIYEDDAIKTEIIIDANNGDVVTTENVAKYLIKHDLILYYLYNEDSLSLSIEYADLYRQNVDIFKSDHDFWIDIRDSASNSEQKNNAQEAADISLEIKSAYEQYVNVTDKIIEIQTRIKSGGTLEDAEDIYEAETESYNVEKQFLVTLNDAIDRFPVIYDTILDTNYRYDISEDEWKQYKSADVTFFKREKDAVTSNIAYWESMKTTLDDDTQRFYESMQDRVKEVDAANANTVPGFTSYFVVISFLILGLFIKNKK